VRVQAGDHVTSRGVVPGGGRGGDAQAGFGDDDGAPPAGDLRRRVPRGVVHDHDLQRRHRLGGQECEAPVELVGVVAGGHHDRHGRSGGGGAHVSARAPRATSAAASMLPTRPAARSPRVSVYVTKMLSSTNVWPTHSRSSQTTATSEPSPTVVSAAEARACRLGATRPARVKTWWATAAIAPVVAACTTRSSRSTRS